MLIEIQGVGFINKGAELMLHAIVEMVRARLPDAQLVMEPGLKGDYEKRARLALLQKIMYQKFRVQWGNMGWMVPASLRKSYGLVTADEIEVVLDASGFKYSIEWGEEETVRCVPFLKRLKRQKKKFIMLPQAFGPFSTPRIREAFKYIALNSDLVFARDDISYKHIVDLTSERAHIKKAPDFTNLLEGIKPKGFDSQRNRFCVIPNYRMIDKTQSNISSSYTHFLATCAKHLLGKGANPFILVHEGADDLFLAQQLVKETGDDINIVLESDPLKIKGIIGSCSGVISSRFHGLVNALSQGVPALGTGWSHKYQMLFNDYGLAEGYISVSNEPADIYEKLDSLLDKEKSNATRKHLVEVNQYLRQLTEKMWDDVFECITKSPSRAY